MRIITLITLLFVVACGGGWTGALEPAEPLPPACETETLEGWTKQVYRGDPQLGAVLVRTDESGCKGAAEMILMAPHLEAKEMYMARTVDSAIGLAGSGVRVSARFRLLEGSAQFGVSVDRRAAKIGRLDGQYEAFWPRADAQTKEVRLWLYADGGQTARVLVDQVRVSIVPWGGK
jgi:hypothetical protein